MMLKLNPDMNNDQLVGYLACTDDVLAYIKRKLDNGVAFTTEELVETLQRRRDVAEL